MVMNANTAALAEGLGLADALGLDLDMLREVFAQTGANSQVLKTDGEDMQNRAHECYFSGAHAAKDSTIAWVLGCQAGIQPAGGGRDQAAVRPPRQPWAGRARQERGRGAHLQGAARIGSREDEPAPPCRPGARRRQAGWRPAAAAVPPSRRPETPFPGLGPVGGPSAWFLPAWSPPAAIAPGPLRPTPDCLRFPSASRSRSARSATPIPTPTSTRTARRRASRSTCSTRSPGP